MKVDAKDAKRKHLQEWQKGQRRDGLESRTRELELWGVFYCMLPTHPFPFKCNKTLLSKRKHSQEWEKGQRGFSSGVGVELELDVRGNGCWKGRKGQMSQKTKSREQRATVRMRQKSEVW